MATITQQWQVDFAGVLMGPGTPYPISDITGLGTPEVRAQDVELPTDDGSFPGVDYYSPRMVTIEAGIRTPGDPQAAVDALAALDQAAADPATRKSAGAVQTLRLWWPGRTNTKRLYGRVRRVEAVSMAQAIYGWIPITLEFTATAPEWHDDTEQQTTLPLARDFDEEGFTAPVTAPITTGVANPQERPGWVTNSGDMAAWPSLTIKGPVVNPRIWITETGRALDLALTLGESDILQIDTRPGTRWVLRNGGNAAYALSAASRLDLFQIPPGRTSEVRWTGADYANSTRLTVSWRDAYTAL
ncbi:phage distal tail protein [Streptomyces sp. ME18-1-4]|uniref:phage distal tail protein n=1 Tax=Streptomyces sp. ME18-1-4 TaxID=3028685 RepID=UPI0029A70D9A|nr:phage tail domain-containing protein [Streptomyces sp. ME18-1-4]MDX3241715.1 phage tail family protein [Streptomyces sp. ME18-1-4]